MASITEKCGYDRLVASETDRLPETGVDTAYVECASCLECGGDLNLVRVTRHERNSQHQVTREPQRPAKCRNR